MRKHLFVTVALGACLGLLAFGADATPINLSAAGGSQNYTFNLGANGSLNLTSWEYDSGAWAAATMVYKSSGPGETGLGVLCNPGHSGDRCGQHEIGSQPWQMISVGLSSLTGYNSLTIGLGSVNGGIGGAPETGYIFGANCTPASCTPVELGSYTFDGIVDTATFTFTKAQLSAYSDIWVTPFTGSNFVDGNILLSSLILNVPEPAALGMFGLGILMIGLLLGLRRRMR